MLHPSLYRVSALSYVRIIQSKLYYHCTCRCVHYAGVHGNQGCCREREGERELNEVSSITAEHPRRQRGRQREERDCCTPRSLSLVSVALATQQQHGDGASEIQYVTSLLLLPLFAAVFHSPSKYRKYSLKWCIWSGCIALLGLCVSLKVGLRSTF